MALLCCVVGGWVGGLGDQTGNCNYGLISDTLVLYNGLNRNQAELSIGTGTCRSLKGIPKMLVSNFDANGGILHTS